MSCPIAVLGAGSWGTALALVLARNGHNVHLWGHHSKHVEQMAQQRCNQRYLPGVLFPDTLQLNHSISQILAITSRILIAVPSHAFREVVQAIIATGCSISHCVWATKGFESGSGKLLHTVFLEEMDKPFPYGVISGPTFAAEVAAGLPTAVTIAASDQTTAESFAQLFHNENFRVYTSPDMTGVEVGGALKNVFAIAAGISDGLGFGANARAALVTRGIAEMARFGVILGGARETFMGLSGIGDLLMTCTDDQSRNRRFGLALGRGETIQSAITHIDQVVEGYQAALEAHRCASKYGLDMPIIEQVYQVLYCARKPVDAVSQLLGREQKAEIPS